MFQFWQHSQVLATKNNEVKGEEESHTELYRSNVCGNQLYYFASEAEHRVGKALKWNGEGVVWSRDLDIPAARSGRPFGYSVTSARAACLANHVYRPTKIERFPQDAITVRHWWCTRLSPSPTTYITCLPTKLPPTYS